MASEKKYLKEGERLRRFIYAHYQTIEAFSLDAGISADTIKSAYLSGRSLLGGELMRRIIPLHFDPTWYLVGVGLPPDPTEDEIAAYIQQLKASLSFYEEFYNNLQAAKLEIANLMLKRDKPSMIMDGENLKYKVKFKPRRKK